MAVAECRLTDRLHAGRNHQLFQRGAVPECADADRCDRFRQTHLFQRRTLVEGAGADPGLAAAECDIAELRTPAEQFILDLSQILRQTDALEAGKIHKSTGTDPTDRIRQNDPLQILTARKCAVVNIFGTFTDLDLLQRREIRKSSRRYDPHLPRNHNALDSAVCRVPHRIRKNVCVI